MTSARHGPARNASGWVAETTAGAFEGTFIVNCAGLHSDRVSRLAGERRDVRIVPFGANTISSGGTASRSCAMIYPVPDPQFPFLGVHYTRMIHGGIEAGPNAVLAFSREATRRRTSASPTCGTR